MVRAEREPQVGRVVLDERNLMLSKLDLSREFIGRRALVTGGTRGIGATISQRLLDAGARVSGSTRQNRGGSSPSRAMAKKIRPCP